MPLGIVFFIFVACGIYTYVGFSLSMKTVVECRSSGHPRTSANVCCRYDGLMNESPNAWICSPFIVLGWTA
jgi:ribosomal protein L32